MTINTTTKAIVSPFIDAMPDDVNAPTIEEAQAIIALDADPILRNLKITQAYHDLSRALAALLGEENVNWCVFATWASKTAGRFIRLRELDAALDGILAETSGFHRWLLKSLDKKLALLNLRHASVRAFIDATAAEMSDYVVAGNLNVFAELGPLFVALVHTVGRDAALDEERLARFLEPLRPGPTEQDGQDSLRDAVTQFYRARFETHPKRKAEHILSANARTGLHEQIRLQDPIAGSINAPLARGLYELCDEIAEKLPSGFLNSLYKLFLTVFRGFIVDEVQRRWQEVVTEHLMEIRLPDGALRLGRDVPVLSGQPPFPPDLQTLDDPLLREILTRFNAADASLRGSEAKNWTDLTERMGYIFDLFRARQQDRGLFVPPFTEAQRRALAENRVPDGAL